MSYFHNALSAAEQAKVSLLVFNTSTRVPQMSTDVWAFELKRQMEQRLSQGNLPFIVVRPTFYMENLLGPWTMSSIARDKVVAYTLEADRKASWISAWDMAQFCVSALERAELAGSFIDVGGSEKLCGHDIAARLSKLTSRAMPYQQIPIEDFEALVDQYIGKRAAYEISRLNQWWVDNREYEPGFVVDVDKLLARLPVENLQRFDQWASDKNWIGED